MRVLHLGAGNLYGGVEKALVSYAAGRASCDYMVPSFAISFAGQLEKELRAEGVEVSVFGPIRLSRWASVVEARRRLSLLLEKTRPNIIVTHGPWVHSVFGAVAKRERMPLALFLHSPPRFGWLDLLASRTQANLVIANSRFTLAKSQWWIKKVPALVCTYPFTEPGHIDRDSARAKLGIPADTVLVVQVSRLDPYKGHRLHLEALSRLGVATAWQALFVGAAQKDNEDYAHSLERMRDRLGLRSRVHFLGHRTDIADVLAAADIFCHPNISPEPFGMVFVEAMLAGVPVVATKLGGAEEILGVSGGVLVPPEAAALSSALGELIIARDRRRDLGSRGRELARSRYTTGQAIRDLAWALSGVLRDGGVH